MNKAIFLDRDGVINEEKGLISKKKDLKLLPKVLDSLKILKDRGYLLIVITNQAIIVRGLISEDQLKEMHEYLNEKLEGVIDRFYFCPHHPEKHDDVLEHALKYRISCECRKPSPGMILQASNEFKIDLKKSWVIGDMISDIVAGKKAGCKTILIESQKNKDIIKSDKIFNTNEKPDFYSKNILETTKIIK